MSWHGVDVIELLLGREGLWARRNLNMIPITSFKTLRNATLVDDTVRTAPGSDKVGSAAVASTGLAAIDYFPTLGTQRTVISFADGTIRKDDGTGGSWSTVKSGLTTSGQVAMFALGGAELVGRSKKLFHADRINAVQVLAADGSATADLSRPPADWASSNQPGWLAQHGRWMWGGGNANDPKRVYRSLGDDHEDFLSQSFSLHLAGDYERLVGGCDYKGGLLVWGYPEGVWFIRSTTPDAPATAWTIDKVGRAGMAGPLNWAFVEDDILWVAPDGSWHLISATNATGSARAQDIAYRKLGSYMAEQINLGQLATAQMVYDAANQSASIACHGQGQTAKNRRIEMDVRLRHDAEVGERWLYHDRHRNEAFFLRKVSEVLTPHFVDNAGQIWRMNRSTRTDDGAGYVLEWLLSDQDLGRLNPAWKGQYLNGRFIQLEYDPRSLATHTVDVYRDGSKKQSVIFDLSGGPTTLPVTLPVTLSDSILTLTRPKPLHGQARRWAFGGSSSVAGADVSLSRILIGLEEAGR